MDQARTAGVVPAYPTGAVARVAFSGTGTDFRRLLVRGAVLELLTFGFYRFWLVTDMRRHLWSHTSIKGDPLEFGGRPMELFVGFLLALAVLLPFYLGYVIVGIAAEELLPFASIGLVLAYWGFAEFAAYRSRRYLLTRTLWRGTRFWMAGTGRAYAARALAWGLVEVFTLGLSLPWRLASLERYAMGNTGYGELRGRFEGRGSELFKRGWKLWLLSILAIVSVVGLLAVPSLLARLGAITARWWAEGVRIGEVHFDSDLADDALVGTYWKFFAITFAIVLAAIVVGFAAIVATVVGIMMYDGTGIPLDEASAGRIGSIVMIATYALALLPLVAVQRFYLLGRVWKIVVPSIAIANLEAADHVTGTASAEDILGAGLGDAFDIGGF